jgi:hypothetical protein
MNSSGRWAVSQGPERDLVPKMIVLWGDTRCFVPLKGGAGTGRIFFPDHAQVSGRATLR